MEPSWASLIATTAISIATVLGTGILALPVTLHKAGLLPFISFFTITLAAQVGVVYAMTELLQRAYALGPKAEPGRSEDYLMIPNEENNNSNNNLPSASMDSLTGYPTAPSLHTISKLFLSHPFLQWMFEGFVLLHFVSIMVSYALAAPQVLGELVPAFGDMGVWKCTLSFSCLATFLILTLSRPLYPLLTIATFIKGVLLTALIGITLGLSLRIGQHPHSQWGQAAVESFLVGSLALSGVVNLMPVTFESCLRSTRRNGSNAVSHRFVMFYRRATLLGLGLCYLLNVGWCVAVLFIVPQDTLAVANEQGQNSTYPLIQALKRHGGNANNTAAFFVTLFTGISVTVSFFVMGMGMKHTLDDQLRAMISRRASPIRRFFTRAAYYMIFFGSIIALALHNPHAFIRVLAGITSFSLNIEAGIFIVYMLHQSRRNIWNHTVLETSLTARTVALLVVGLTLYFITAVVIDLTLYLLRTR